MGATPRPQGFKIQKSNRLVYNIQNSTGGIGFLSELAGLHRDQAAIDDLHVLVKLAGRRRTTIKHRGLEDGQIEALVDQNHGIFHGLQNLGLGRLLPLALGRDLFPHQGDPMVGRFQCLAKTSNLRGFLCIGLLQLGQLALTQLQLHQIGEM